MSHLRSSMKGDEILFKTGENNFQYSKSGYGDGFCLTRENTLAFAT